MQKSSSGAYPLSYMMIATACCLSLTSCAWAPGQSLDVKQAHVSHDPVAEFVKPTILEINPLIIRKTSAVHRCVANDKEWLCNDKEHYEYHVGPEDILNIIVWDHPELSMPQGEYRSAQETGILVNSDGTIFYPFAGRMKVQDMNVEQIRQRLTEKLKKYIQDPQVSVRVAEFNSQKVQIMGAVAQQMSVAIKNTPLNLMQAINEAGGIVDDIANAKYIYVIRGPITQPYLFWLNANTPGALLLAEQFYLQADDIVYVSTAGIVRWQRVISNIMPSFSAGSTIRSTTK